MTPATDSEVSFGVVGPIAIVGAYPPPIGGNAIHIQRLSLACRRRGIECFVVDMYGQRASDTPEWVYRPGGGEARRLAGAVGWLSRRSWDLVHFHVSSMDRFLWAAWPLLLATARFKSRLITIHSGSFVREMGARCLGFRTAAAHLLGKFSLIITVSQEQKEFLSHVMKLDPRRIEVIPAFIPPDAVENDHLPATIGDIAGRAPLIVGSGYAKPVYGHHLLLEAVRRLQASGMNVSLVLALYSKYDQGYLHQLEAVAKTIDRCAITKDLSPQEFNSLLAKADLYVRTSFTDGDSVAVREALYRGCPVLASDCVQRPQGVSLFRTGSIEALYDSLQLLLATGKSADPLDGVGRDYSEDVIALYEKYCLSKAG